MFFPNLPPYTKLSVNSLKTENFVSQEIKLRISFDRALSKSINYGSRQIVILKLLNNLFVCIVVAFVLNIYFIMFLAVICSTRYIIFIAFIEYNSIL